LNADADPVKDPAGKAAEDLARVRSTVEATRVVLARLLQEVSVAESRLSNSRAAQMLEANEQLVVTALRNQTEAEIAAKLLAKVSQSAEVDPLTQLPNRVVLLDRVAQAIANAKRNDGRLGLLFLDLNNFKQANDTLGHAAGDEVLKVVAHRLVSTVRDADTVSRHGGDEFLILLTDIAQPSDAGLIASKLSAALGVPSRIGDQVLRLTASIGISIYPDDGDEVNTLVQRADSAMYRAKRHGLGSFAFYGSEAAGQGAPVRPPVAALRNPVARHDAAVEEHNRRRAELQEANEQLVLAALTAQELQAAAERARRRQAEFMSLVAKELGNPLAPIRLAAAMLGQVRAAEPLLPRAQSIIETQVERMSRLLVAVEEVSQAGTVASSVAFQTVDLVGVVDAAVAACRPAMDRRLQSFTAYLPEQEVPVRGEPTRLQQIVRNLLDNASQYTPDLGEIQLALMVKGDAVELTVSDNGIGITSLALPTLFEPFVQDIPAVGFNGGGLGIGLAVVRMLVEAHSGTVVARSAGTGRGSQFTVTLPLAKGSADPYEQAADTRGGASAGAA
jgi:diguanylate cyclase (GGDEF)-like protein